MADEQLTEPLPLGDRAEMASTQLGMEMAGGGVMTTRRLGQVASEWGSEGDSGVVLAAVWGWLVESSCGR